jgi:hypothetical protein
MLSDPSLSIIDIYNLLKRDLNLCYFLLGVLKDIHGQLFFYRVFSDLLSYKFTNLIVEWDQRCQMELKFDN